MRPAAARIAKQSSQKGQQENDCSAADYGKGKLNHAALFSKQAANSRRNVVRLYFRESDTEHDRMDVDGGVECHPSVVKCRKLGHSSRIDTELFHARNERGAFDPHPRRSAIRPRYPAVRRFEHTQNLVPLV